MSSTYDTPFPTASQPETSGSGSQSTASAGMSGSAQGTVQTPLGDRDIVARAAEGAHQQVDRIAARASDGLAAAGDMLAGNAEKMRGMTDEWAESLRNTVREKPLVALATAVAVGMLIARLTR